MKTRTNYFHLSRWSWEGIAIAVSIVFGSLFHFTYEWANKSPGVAWFSAIDESVMSHLCLLNVPWMIMTLILFLVSKRIGFWRRSTKLEHQDVWLSRAIGLLTAIAIILLIFYSYTVGNTRPSILAVDILTFVIAIVGGCVVSALLGNKWTSQRVRTMVGVVLHVMLFSLFVLFGYWRPTKDVEPFVIPNE